MNKYQNTTPEPKSTLYVGYGANRDEAMIQAITGQKPEVVAKDVKIQDAELCVQQLDQITDKVFTEAPEPVSPLDIMQTAWGKKRFETYAIRPKTGSTVTATLFKLTAPEREGVAEWELVPFDWYQRMRVSVELPDGTIIPAETEGFIKDQRVDRVADGGNYITYLADEAEMLAVAEQVRPDFLK